MDVSELAVRDGHSQPSRLELVYHETHGSELRGKKIGPTLLVLGKESEPVREVLLRLERRAMETGRRAPTSEEIRRDSVEVARAAVVGWENWDWRGEKNVPFSKELWNEILDDFYQFWWIADLVDRHLHRSNGHFQKPSGN